MRIRMKLIQYDLLEDQAQHLFETNALLDDSTLRYREVENKAIDQVYFGDDAISFDRRADIHTHVILYDTKTGSALIDSPYGQMKMETKLCYADKADDYWVVEYQLLQNQVVVVHQRLKWEFTTIKNN